MPFSIHQCMVFKLDEDAMLPPIALCLHASFLFSGSSLSPYSSTPARSNLVNDALADRHSTRHVHRPPRTVDHPCSSFVRDAQPEGFGFNLDLSLLIRSIPPFKGSFSNVDPSLPRCFSHMVCKRRWFRSNVRHCNDETSMSVTLFSSCTSPSLFLRRRR